MVPSSPFFLSPSRKGGAAFNGKYLLNKHVLFDHPCRDGPIWCFFFLSTERREASSQHEQLWFAMIWHLSLVGYPNWNQFLSVLFFILAQDASRKLKVLKEICSWSPYEDRCKNGIVGKQRNHFKSETGINSQKINKSPGDLPHIQTNTITMEDDHLLRGLASFEWFLNVRGYAKFARPDLYKIIYQNLKLEGFSPQKVLS